MVPVTMGHVFRQDPWTLDPYHKPRIMAYGKTARYLLSHPYVRQQVARGAYSAGRMARSYIASRMARPRRPLPAAMAVSTSTRRFPGMSTGYYKGRFAKRSSANDVSSRKLNYYSGRGYVTCQEVFGQCNDVDCVYVGHTTYNKPEIAKAIACATLRSLLIKAGFNPDSPQQEIPFNLYNQSTGFTLNWVEINADGAVTPVQYTIPDNTNLSNLATASGFYDRILSRMDKDDGSVRYEIDRIALYSLDFNVTATGRLAAEINLKREHIELEIISTLVVQNRTKPATGSGTTTDAVDNQPLKGYRYECSNGVPTVKTMGNDGLEKMLSNGVLLQQAVDLSPASLFKEPPPPRMFSNCRKYNRVALEPGEIKRSSIVWRVTGLWNTVIQQRLTSQKGVANENIGKAPGRCELFAMEERLNSGSSNAITIQYECDKKTMCRTWQGKLATMLPDYTQIEQNNTTP